MNMVFRPGKAATRVAGKHDADLCELNSLCVRALRELFNDKERFFCERLSQTSQGFLREGISRKGTIVALLGLQQLAASGAQIPFDLPAMAASLLDRSDRMNGIGDLGLLIWMAAVCAPREINAVCRHFHLERALESYVDARRARTSDLAWFLAGLAHVVLAQPDTLPELTDPAVDAYHRLIGNLGEDNLFRHRGNGTAFEAYFTNRFGTFYDQTCSIYALSKFAQAFHVEEPLGAAIGCATTICKMQGNMGQWWCLYDARKGCIARPYPVLSMNQDGVLPMAFFALEDATGINSDDAIYKGLSWIWGANELGRDLRDDSRTLIWDSIGFKSPGNVYWDTALALMSVSRTAKTSDLGIHFEARPEHFGWALYAFGRFGLEKH